LMSCPWTTNTRTVTAVTEAKVEDITAIDTIKRLRLPPPAGTRPVATPKKWPGRLLTRGKVCYLFQKCVETLLISS
jgi:hypothetical protein